MGLTIDKGQLKEQAFSKAVSPYLQIDYFELFALIIAGQDDKRIKSEQNSYKKCKTFLVTVKSNKF